MSSGPLEGNLHEVLGVPQIADEQDGRTQQSSSRTRDELLELTFLKAVHPLPWPAVSVYPFSRQVGQPR